MFRWFKTSSKGEIAYVTVKEVTLLPDVLDRIESLYIDKNKTLPEIAKLVQIPPTKVRDALLSVGLEVGQFCKEGLLHSWEVEDLEDRILNTLITPDCAPRSGFDKKQRRSQVTLGEEPSGGI